jgi:putative iron-regulated protein
MRRTYACVVLLLLCACGGDDGADTERAVVRQYAQNLDANYKDVIAKLEALKTAVDAFVQAPSQQGLAAAQKAWLDARPAYGECEISRFYAGPLDQAQGRMNEWPIDESFIDYTAGNPTGGIINQPQTYPIINEQVLASADERGGIENLSTGFHAIEFLLWGQRPDQTSGPGQRPFTDYVDGGTAQNQDRRRAYLQTVTSMLLEDMQAVDADWDLSNSQSYGAMLVLGSPQDGVGKILRGLSQLAISELLYERMSDPFVTQDKKDEESCFSENTSVDLAANMLGVEDVYLGRYHDLHGPSLADLVHAKNATLDAQIRQQLTAGRAAIDAIPPPFDHAVIAPPSSDAHAKVQAAIDTLTPLRGTLMQLAQTLGVSINL